MLRFLPLKLGRLYRCLKLLFVIGLFVILLMNTHNLFASFQKNELTDRRFINLNKCPACFGTSWCRKFMNGQISFETWGRLRFLDVFNVKNVFFAQYGEPREGTRRIVLKRLGSNQELTDIDQKICKRATGRPRCDLIQAMYKTEFARLNGDVRLLTPDVVEGWSDLVHCPSQRLLDRIVRRYAETKDSGSFLLKNLKDTERMQLLMTLAFNPEPLVLQVGFFVLSTNPSLSDRLPGPVIYRLGYKSQIITYALELPLIIPPVEWNLSVWWAANRLKNAAVNYSVCYFPCLSVSIPGCVVCKPQFSSLKSCPCNLEGPQLGSV